MGDVFFFYDMYKFDIVFDVQVWYCFWWLYDFQILNVFLLCGPHIWLVCMSVQWCSLLVNSPAISYVDLLGCSVAISWVNLLWQTAVISYVDFLWCSVAIWYVDFQWCSAAIFYVALCVILLLFPIDLLWYVRVTYFSCFQWELFVY